MYLIMGERAPFRKEGIENNYRTLTLPLM